MQQTKDIFSERLKKLMKDREMSQLELAERLGMSRQAISLYVKGERNPDIDVLKRIADIFSVSSDWLIGITDFQTKSLDTSAFCCVSGITENAAAHLLFTRFPDIFSRILESDFFDDFIGSVNALLEGSFALSARDDLQQYEINYQIECLRYMAHKMFDLILNEFDRRELDDETALEISRITEEKDIELYQQIDKLLYDFYIATSEDEKEKIKSEIVEIRKQIAHRQTEGT